MTAPTNVFDPQVMLATSLHSQPGVYALLLGSGVSTGAGIPTGWGVVKELVRRAAAASAPDDPAAAEQAAGDPEAWWAANGDGEPLGYSNLLAALAPTPGARRGLLAAFFEPSEQDAEEGLKVPGPAHRAIAELVKRGFIRVILTTNFDRLLERALEDAGVPPQVVSRPEAVAGLTPLPHAAVTVVKLHGDYAELDMRNTVEELDVYPPEWETLLTRITDEYGLLISGWSADWDTALVRGLEGVRQRRYPLFWDARSSNGSAAKRLLTQHGGVVVPASSADDLFTGLVDRIDALDRLGEAPLTTAVAVARLKRYLPDPKRRIDLEDLVGATVESVRAKAAAQPVNAGLTYEFYERVLAERLADAAPALHLLAAGVVHDRERRHTHVWIDALQRLMQARTPFEGTYQQPLDQSRSYPALLALRVAGIAALLAGADDVLLRLFREPTYRNRFLNNARIPAAHALHDHAVLNSDLLNKLPRWNGTRWIYPESHLIRTDLRDLLRPLLPDETDYKWAHDRFEYRMSMFVHQTQGTPGAFRLVSGEFIGDWQWNSDDVPLTEVDFLTDLGQADDDWPWWQVLGGRDEAGATVEALRDSLKKVRRWG
jgi:hypothetical protein